MQTERRKKTFTAAILNIVAYSIYILFSAIVMFYILVLAKAIIDAATSDGSTPVVGSLITLIGSYVLNIILNIICLVLSCKCIKISKMSVQDYASKKSIVMTCYILNIIVVVFGFLSLISTGFSLLSIIDVAIWAMLIVSAVFFAIDLKENQKQVQAEQAKVFESVASSTTQTTEASADKKEEENVEKKIEELNKMKADGLITDEEFEKLKKDLMK